MSTDLNGPEPPSPPSPFGQPPSGPNDPIDPVEWLPPLPRPKFQHNYSRHILFFLLTFVTTTLAQVLPVMGALAFGGQNPLPLLSWSDVLSGLSYSVPLLMILSAHEFGHYIACRIHNVDASLPYFIPAPFLLTGTFGAVIRIREAFPSKRALFDIGVAGPIAGFLVMLPFLYLGMTLSEVTAVPVDRDSLYFGEPLLWKALELWHFGVVPEGLDVALHPVGFAAWFGMLATALNLLPFGQLDGGHIMYASLGRRAASVSAVTLVAVGLLSLRSTSWVVTGVLMAVMAFMFGFRHPRVIDEHEPLDPVRQLVALFALVIFVLCFTPVPIALTRP